MVAVQVRTQPQWLAPEVTPADLALTRPRRDALPEHTLYLDTGCEIHPTCLSCPLVRCRYDEPGGVRGMLSKERDRAIIALQRQGRTVNAIAQRFGISRRTVFRVLAKAKGTAGVKVYTAG